MKVASLSTPPERMCGARRLCATQAPSALRSGRVQVVTISDDPDRHRTAQGAVVIGGSPGGNRSVLPAVGAAVPHAPPPGSGSRTQQRLDGAALVHGLVAFGEGRILTPFT